MNFKLEGFKPIQSAEIVVNDLTLIFGDNNNGKTYFAYALYGLLKAFKSINIEILTKKMENDLLANNKITINKAKLNLEDIIENVAKSYAKKIHSFVFSSENQNIPIISLSSLSLSTEKTKQTINIGGSSIIIDSNKEWFEITIKNQDTGLNNIIIYEINQALLTLLFDIPDVFISVAERLGISLFQKDLDLNINTLVDHIKKSKEINPFDLIRDYSSRYALPVKDNIDFIRAIETIQKGKTTLKIDLSTHIKKMIGGKLKYNGNEVRLSNNRRGDNKMDIPIYLTSASVRALSSLYFFLKHKAKPGDLIIIDEPESHLSLAKQRLLAKLIADCINNDLKIMLTTHSDTLVLELNNLIMLNSNFDDKDSFMKKNHYENNNIINPDKVSAYIAENGGMTKCNIDKYGMEVDSMDKEINKLNTIRDGLEARL